MIDFSSLRFEDAAGRKLTQSSASWKSRVEIASAWDRDYQTRDNHASACQTLVIQL